MKRLTANLLDHGDYNVIIVNWGGGSMPMYSQATSNTRVVGLEIGHMVNTMIVSETTKVNFISYLISIILFSNFVERIWCESS